MEMVEHPRAESERVCSACGRGLAESGVEIHRSLQMKNLRRGDFYPTSMPAKLARKRPEKPMWCLVLRSPV